MSFYSLKLSEKEETKNFEAQTICFSKFILENRNSKIEICVQLHYMNAI